MSDVRMPPGLEAKAVLGKGAMGRVYKAWQPKLQRFVAVKTCNLREAREAGQDPGRLEDEALTIARLNHPNIISLYDVFRDSENIYLIMELAEGAPLNALVDRRVSLEKLGPLAQMVQSAPTARTVRPEWVCRIGAAVAKALDYAHGRDVLHRDVKPANILVTNDLHIKLLDFSIARSTGSTMGRTATGTIFGTVAYMSPEQVLSKALDGRTDIYSLGATLFHLAVGEVLFPDDSDIGMCMRHVNDAPPDPALINPVIRPPLNEILLRTLAKDPAARYDSARELDEALSSIIRDAENQRMGSGAQATVQRDPTPPPATPTPSPQADSAVPAPASSAAQPPEEDSTPGTTAAGKKLRSLSDLAPKSSLATGPVPRGPLDEWAERRQRPPAAPFAPPGPSKPGATLADLASLEARQKAGREARARKMRLGAAGLGGALVLAAAAVAGVMLLGGGGEEPGPAPRPTPAPATTPLATPAPAPIPVPTATPPPGETPEETPRSTPEAEANYLPVPAPPAQDPRARRFDVPLPGGATMQMVEVPAGSFLMGSPEDEPERDADEGPRTRVTLARPYFIGRTEVTRAQWRAVMGAGSAPGDDLLPMTGVTWEQAAEFLRRLSVQAGVEFRLPTEAQWEHAARAGTDTPFTYGEVLASTLANIDGQWPYPRQRPSEYRGTLLPAGSLPPNAWGLADMHGNAWEMMDGWHTEALPGGALADPPAVASGARRVLRGGSFLAGAGQARSASREPVDPAATRRDAGLRVVVELPVGEPLAQP